MSIRTFWKPYSKDHEIEIMLTYQNAIKIIQKISSLLFFTVANLFWVKHLLH